MSHTRIRNLDLDHASLEALSVQVQGLPEAISRSKLDIAESLGTHQLAVLNDTHTRSRRRTR